MPIFEFKCLKCNDIFELLMINSQDQFEMKCPKCEGQDVERVMSTTNFAMAAGGGGGADASVGTQSRSCGGGNCTTWTLPGHAK